MSEIKQIPIVKPATSDALMAVVRSIIDAAVSDEMVYISVSYKFKDGRKNAYSVSVDGKN